MTYASPEVELVAFEKVLCVNSSPNGVHDMDPDPIVNEW